MNRIFKTPSKNRKIQKPINKITSFYDMIYEEDSINGFNIIELKEEEINSGPISDLPNLPEKEIIQIKKKAQEIEGYYLKEGKETKIKENCFNCLMNDFQANELLYFVKRKDLLIYLRYCFYFLKNFLFIDKKIYIINKYDLDKCNSNYLNGWKFFIPKTICKGCFLKVINMEHLLGNLKKIFSDFDSKSYRRNFRKNKSYLRPIIRIKHIIQKNEDGIRGKSNNLECKRGHIRKKPKKNVKNNNNIIYNNKKVILSKNNILSLNSLENKKKFQFLGKKKKSGKKLFGEQIVTEIKIKANEFLQGNIEMNDANNGLNNNLNNNNIEIKIDSSEKNQEDNKISNSFIIKNNNISTNKKNTSIIENNNKQNKFINSKKEDTPIMTNKEQSLSDIFQDIMITKEMSNKTVMKLHYKLDIFLCWIFHAFIDVKDFREKLNNTLNIVPLIIQNLGASKLPLYEQNYKNTYNLLFKDRKEFEEILKKIKNDSINSISNNLMKLKEVKNLKEEEIKTLDEMKHSLDKYKLQFNELEKKYNFKIKNYFIKFNDFLKLIGEIKESFT